MKFLIPANDMIQHIDPKNFTRFQHSLSKSPVFRTGRSVSSRMIMRADDRHREVLEGALEYLADDGRGVVDGAFLQIFNGDDAVLGIKEYDFENFFLHVPHLGHQDINDVFGGLDLRAFFFDFVFPKTPADFQRGFDLGDFGGPETFEFYPIPRVDVAHVAEGLEFVKGFSGQVQGALAPGAGAKQDGEQFGIAQGPLAVLHHLLPRTVLWGPLANGRRVFLRLIHSLSPFSLRENRPIGGLTLGRYFTRQWEFVQTINGYMSNQIKNVLVLPN